MKKNIGISLLFLIIFVIFIVAILVNSSFISYIDKSVFSFIHSFRNEFLDYFFVVISYFGEDVTIVMFCIILLILPCRKFIGYPVISFTVLSAGINSLIKWLIHRPRPALSYFLIDPPLNYQFPTSHSFPSGHSQTSFLFFAILFTCLILYYICDKKKQIVLLTIGIILASLLPISRIYIGVHYPSDCIAGFSLGCFLLCIFWGCTDYIPFKRNVNVKITYPENSIDSDIESLRYKITMGEIIGLYEKNGENQECYILGLHEPTEYTNAKLIAVIKRYDDIKNMYVVSVSKNEYTKSEIDTLVNFIEEDYDYKITML